MRLESRAVRQKNVFGGRGFLLGKTTLVIVWGDDLLLKTHRDDHAAALSEPGITAFAPGGEKPMSTWVIVPGDRVADDPELVEWLRRALKAVR
ncbi:MAG: hypothetical protein NVS1B4_06920 [Gemmatimonadaceae bacterium]